MIGDPRQAERLTKKLEAALPLPAIVTPELAAALRRRSPGADPPQRCTVTEVFYGGDDGGILCGLDLGTGEDAGEALVVSITYLAFAPELPLATEIAAYRAHRLEHLQHAGGSPGAQAERSPRQKPLPSGCACPNLLRIAAAQPRGDGDDDRRDLAGARL